jgi:hypothetical protein
MLFVLGVTTTLLTFGVRVLASPTGKLYGMPAAPFLIFGSVGLLACVGDLRLIRAGGVQTIRGAPRLARHLWRMSTAFLIAAFSFFLGQAKVIPKPIRMVPLLVIPPLVVLATMLYWLWRVRVRRSVRGLQVKCTPMGCIARAKGSRWGEITAEDSSCHREERSDEGSALRGLETADLHFEPGAALFPVPTGEPYGRPRAVRRLLEQGIADHPQSAVAHSR